MGVDFSVEVLDDDASWFEIRCDDEFSGHRPSDHVLYREAAEVWFDRLRADQVSDDCCGITARVDPDLTQYSVQLDAVTGEEVLHLLGISDPGAAGLLAADDVAARVVLARAFAPADPLPLVFYRGELNAAVLERGRSTNLVASALDDLDLLVEHARDLDRAIVWNR